MLPSNPQLFQKLAHWHRSVAAFLTKLFWWETSRDHLIYLSTQAEATQSRLLKTVPRWVLSVSKDTDSPGSLLWASCASAESLSQYSKCLLIFRWNSLIFSLRPLPPVSGQHWEKPSSLFFIPSHQMFMHTDEIPLNLPRAACSQLPSPLLICFTPFITSAEPAPLSPHLSYAGEPRPGHSTPGMASPGQCREERSSLFAFFDLNLFWFRKV